MVTSIASVDSLGIDKVELANVDDDCTDGLAFAEDKATYRIKKGKEGL